MGKGSNASKNARARADAAKRDAVKPGGGGAAGAAERSGASALSLFCVICKATFLPTGGDSQRIAHVESKHPKNSYAECFPAASG